MNREEYLRTRIAKIAEELCGGNITLAQRRNLERALKYYIEDLRNKNQ